MINVTNCTFQLKGFPLKHAYLLNEIKSQILSQPKNHSVLDPDLIGPVDSDLGKQ